MSQQELIRINIKPRDVRAHLLKLVRSEHSTLIVDTIMGHLSQNTPGLEQLFLALNGIQKKLEYKPLDEVWFPLDKAPSWKVNKEHSRAKEGMIYQDYFKAKVIKVNPYASYRVKINYTYMDDKNTEGVYEEWVDEDNLISASEPLFEDKVTDDGLPF